MTELHIAHANCPLKPVTASLGLACFPAHGADQNSLLRAADEALYASKHAGRNRFTVAAQPQGEVMLAG